MPIASKDSKFDVLRRKQTIEVKISINVVVDLLHEGSSFRNWHETDLPPENSYTIKLELNISDVMAELE
jgi:hypothetical protein